MDIISAYREVGSYRGAAAICATTPKTVRRVIERHEAGGTGPECKPRERNYEPVAELVAKKVIATRLKLAAMRRLAPELLLTTRTQRRRPEELLRTLVEAEKAGRLSQPGRSRRARGGGPRLPPPRPAPPPRGGSRR